MGILDKIKKTSPHAILVILAILGSHCNPFADSESDDDGLGLAALLLAVQTGTTGRNANNEPLETRPFRARTVTLGADKKASVYDWNQDNWIPIYSSNTGTPDTELENITSLHPAENGRYSFALVEGSPKKFRILDTTLNLSPHGDHFHYDRANYYRTIAENRLDNLPTGTANLDPVSIYSKTGWTGIYYKNTSGSGNSAVRFLRESKIDAASSTSPLRAVTGPAVLDHGVDGKAVLISTRNNQYTALVATKGDSGNGGKPTEFKLYTANIPSSASTDPTWADASTGTPPNSPSTIPAVSCETSGTSNFHSLTNSQVPTSGAVFTQLESGYDKIHYVILSCGDKLHVFRHEDSSNSNRTTYYEINTAGIGSKEFTYIRPIQQNINVERGGRTAQPMFVANTGSNSENSFFLIQPENKSIEEVGVSSPYRSGNLGSELRAGESILILANNGSLLVYDRDTKTRTSVMESNIPVDRITDGTARFHSTWDATFVTLDRDIHEFNTKQSYKARVVSNQSGQNIQSMTVHGFVGPGSDYEGDPH